MLVYRLDSGTWFWPLAKLIFGVAVVALHAASRASRNDSLGFFVFSGSAGRSAALGREVGLMGFQDPGSPPVDRDPAAHDEALQIAHPLLDPLEMGLEKARPLLGVSAVGRHRIPLGPQRRDLCRPLGRPVPASKHHRLAGRGRSRARGADRGQRIAGHKKRGRADRGEGGPAARGGRGLVVARQRSEVSPQNRLEGAGQPGEEIGWEGVAYNLRGGARAGPSAGPRGSAVRAAAANLRLELVAYTEVRGGQVPRQEPHARHRSGLPGGRDAR
mmetsp:Transcript_43130/g.97470  ORF Transcript_43130/g.97470 Transcript_43130/m.97470 type:complete len:273 (-) Transcript_43130:432-1250(-)